MFERFVGRTRVNGCVGGGGDEEQPGKEGSRWWRGEERTGWGGRGGVYKLDASAETWGVRDVTLNYFLEEKEEEGLPAYLGQRRHAGHADQNWLQRLLVVFDHG
jgi:hypothetical protein